MEVKEEYKMTEVGVIPEGWKTDRIKNIALITTGSKNTQDRIEEGEYPFFVRSSNVERINTFSFEGEAILTAGDGVGTGKVFHYINGKFDFHQRVYKISNFSQRVDGFFFYLYFSSHFFERISAMTAKSSVDSVRMEMIANMQIPLPKYKEQTAIAKVLSDTDALIQSLEKLIAKKQSIKQGTMQLLLIGKRRLPGFSGEWEVKKLGEIATIVGGGTPSTSVSSYWNGVINWFTPTEVGETKYLSDSIRKITKEGLRNISANILPAGTILLTTRAGIGDVGILLVESCTNQGFQSLIANENTSNEFLYYFVLTIKNLLIQNASGSTFLEISPSKLKKIEVTVPYKKEEQRAIAKVLSNMDEELAALEKKLYKYQQMKQGMMQNLLTGKIRLV